MIYLKSGGEKTGEECALDREEEDAEFLKEAKSSLTLGN